MVVIVREEDTAVLFLPGDTKSETGPVSLRAVYGRYIDSATAGSTARWNIAEHECIDEKRIRDIHLVPPSRFQRKHHHVIEGAVVEENVVSIHVSLLHVHVPYVREGTVLKLNTVDVQSLSAEWNGNRPTVVPEMIVGAVSKITVREKPFEMSSEWLHGSTGSLIDVVKHDVCKFTSSAGYCGRIANTYR